MANGRHHLQKPFRKPAFALVLALFSWLGAGTPAATQSMSRQEIERRLIEGYPQSIRSAGNGRVTFSDGTDLPLDDGVSKNFDVWLARPDIDDMFRFPYPAMVPAVAPPEDFDPGRARNEAFFRKVYGDCVEPGFSHSLEDVIWLPKKAGERLKVTSINGVAKRLRAVSAELDELPPAFDLYLTPSGGAYNCRSIAGSQARSAHGYGIAIDLATRRAHYWRWHGIGHKEVPAHMLRYRNEIPLEIVRIFEKHGFIWGGRWYHFDTMHFEYRPELLPPESNQPP